MNNFTIYIGGGKTLQSDKTLVMGILNATPDSFSDGGNLSRTKELRQTVTAMIEAGVDILDVGGESTRPGHNKVSAEEELERILPVIKEIRKISDVIPVSIDTQKAGVADQALKHGANLINDVSALADPHMPEIVKAYGCSIILMRNRPTPSDVISETRRQFEEIIKKAGDSGINKDEILLDAGLGFGDLASGDYSLPPGSDPLANIRLITHISDYSLGLPVVIGASRKRFIGDLADAEDPKNRLAGSLAAAILAKQKGAAIVRVHDVAETIQAFKLIDSQ